MAPVGWVEGGGGVMGRTTPILLCTVVNQLAPPLGLTPPTLQPLITLPPSLEPSTAMKRSDAVATATWGGMGGARVGR